MRAALTREGPVCRLRRPPVEPAEAASEEGLPCIKDLNDSDRGTENVDNGRVEREDLHTLVTSDSVGCIDAIHSNASEAAIIVMAEGMDGALEVVEMSMVVEAVDKMAIQDVEPSKRGQWSQSQR